jgi:hypothetical protein
MKPSFAEGIIVQYKQWVGEVRFVCDEYISVCVRIGDNRVNDVCVLVHRNDWNHVKLLKESNK